MSTDRYIYVKSDESNAYFVNNSTHRFKVQLKLQLYLPGKWKVGLVHFHATEKGKSMKADEGLYDLCKESIVYGEERPLLCRVEKSSKGKWDYAFLNPFYVPVKKQELREFEIYIKREGDEDATQLKKPVFLTLHLK